MHIHKLSENTIKVILTKEDFLHRNIDVKKLQPGSQVYRQLVLEVMAQASGEFNFDVNDCRLVVEGQMSLKNELTLIITKAPIENQQNLFRHLPGELSDKIPTPEEMARMIDDALSGMPFALPDKTIPEKNNTDILFPTDLVICFKDFDKLVALLHKMPTASKIASTLYMYEQSYYLVLKVYERNASLAISFRNQASEFDGEQITSEFILPLLLEHGSLIIKKGAIPTLVKKFKE